MKERRLYYRRKAGGVIIEGKQDAKSILIKTLPKNPMKLLEIMKEASYISEEKWLEIQEKIRRLSYKADRKAKGAS